MAHTTRQVDVPRTISTAAQSALEATYGLDLGDAPPPADVDEWEALISFANDMLLATIPPPATGTKVYDRQVAGVDTFVVEPDRRCSGKTCLFLHGGAFNLGAGVTCRAMTASFADGAQVRTIGLDYRMPPRHPYPAALDDAVALFGALLDEHEPDDIVVAGGSAGGNLAAALVLRARDEGLPLPAAVVLLSPEADLTESGDSFSTLLGIDPVLRASLESSIRLYAGDRDLRHPYLSPLFGDFAAGFAPTFLQSGTRDLFLSNTVRLHRALRRAGVPAELHVWDAMPHGGFGAMLDGGLGQVPEDQEVYGELRNFLGSVSGASARSS